MVFDAKGEHGSDIIYVQDWWSGLKMKDYDCDNSDEFQEYLEKEGFVIFNDDLDGINKSKSFLDNLGIDYTPDEFTDEKVWIKPIRDLHHSNRPEDESLIDETEFLVISGEPKSSKVEKSMIDRFLSIFKTKQKKSRSVFRKR